MTDHDLSGLLERFACESEVGPPPLARMAATARRTRRRRGVLTVAGSVVAVTVVAVGVTELVSSTTGSSPQPPLTADGTPAGATTAGSPRPAPPGTRLVALGRVGVYVPDSWGPSTGGCGNPIDSYVVDAQLGPCTFVPRGVYDSVWLSPAAQWEGTGVIREALVDGLSAQQQETECHPQSAFPTLPPLTECTGDLYFPDDAVLFHAVAPTASGVDRILDGVTVLPADKVGVPGFADLYAVRGPQGAVEGMYAERLHALGLLTDVRHGDTPDQLLRVEPRPGTVVPVGSTVQVTVAQ